LRIEKVMMASIMSVAVARAFCPCRTGEGNKTAPSVPNSSLSPPGRGLG
jgi:hypothetical protein